MHGLTDCVIAAECEREVGNTSGCERARKVCLDPSYGLDKVDCISCMFLDACSDGKDVDVEYDVFRADSGLFCEETVGPFADLDLPFECCRLSLLVECHDDHGGAEILDCLGFLNERFRTFL